MLLVVGFAQSHIVIRIVWPLYGKVVDLAQASFKCPFCDAPAWHTRLMLWKHLHMCIRNNCGYNPTVGVNSEVAVVTSP
jgi:hypothetical protein